MKILNEPPPNFKRIKEVFPVSKYTVYCYGDTLYNPNNLFLPPDILTHEEVHAKQQGRKPDEWWEKYFVDEDFRFKQELEAYQTQAKYIAKYTKDKNECRRKIAMLAVHLSSQLYGSIVGPDEALKRITE